jgi:hypothetical protein
MKPTNRIARQSGLLYLLLIPFGVFGILYVPSQLIVEDNITASINNIIGNQFLFRASIASALVTQILQILLVLALYQLLKSVNKKVALLMVISILVAVPIAMLNELNHFAVLLSLDNAEQANLFLGLHEYGVNIAQIFWGIWLFPMGYLVYKSGFLPKFIGVLLMIGCFGYLIDSFAVFFDLDLKIVFSEFTFIGEVVLPVWLLVKGVKGN